MSGEIQDDMLGGLIGAVHGAANTVRGRLRESRMKHWRGLGAQKSAPAVPSLGLTSIQVIEVHIQSGQWLQIGQAGDMGAQQTRYHVQRVRSRGAEAVLGP